jgi:polysaccharide deacetylase family protein (PEP-CTERM system associated)
VRATWFVLGWVAERRPDVVRRIASAGHEVASHGFGHELLPSLAPEDFRADVERSKALLEDLAQATVQGYRAPSFSITEWAIPILRESGYRYDSSFFGAVAHDRYGRLPGIRPDEPVVEVAPGFYEVAVSCLTVGRIGLPWGGGGYFRLLPYGIFRRGIHHVLAKRRPYVFYIHPWEIDPEQPRVQGLPRAKRFRHYVGIDRCEARFTRLLRELRWSTMSALVEAARKA